jgi:hypothetical protein
MRLVKAQVFHQILIFHQDLASSLNALGRHGAPLYIVGQTGGHLAVHQQPGAALLALIDGQSNRIGAKVYYAVYHGRYPFPI